VTTRLPDAYTFQARIVPVFAVLLAPLFLLGAGIISSAKLGLFSGLAITVAAMIFGQLGRDRGKQLERGLWESWGGAPTLRRLRYRDNADQQAVDRLHGRIGEVLAEPLPTFAEEDEDPAGADARYREVTGRLIALTYDHDKFPLVFAENVNYGMRRNLLGLRPVGIAVALVTAIAALLLLLLAAGHLKQRAARYAPGLGVAALVFVFWIWTVTPAWVKVPAEDYADRLMASVELLRQPATGADRK
jgi:hypothetical protein